MKKKELYSTATNKASIRVGMRNRISKSSRISEMESVRELKEGLSRKLTTLVNNIYRDFLACGKKLLSLYFFKLSFCHERVNNFYLKLFSFLYSIFVTIILFSLIPKISSDLNRKNRGLRVTLETRPE